MRWSFAVVFSKGGGLLWCRWSFCKGGAWPWSFAVVFCMGGGLLRWSFVVFPPQKTTAHAKDHPKRPPPMQKTTPKGHCPCKRPPQKTTTHAKDHPKRPLPMQKTIAKDHRPCKRPPRRPLALHAHCPDAAVASTWGPAAAHHACSVSSLLLWAAYYGPPIIIVIMRRLLQAPYFFRRAICQWQVPPALHHAKPVQN